MTWCQAPSVGAVVLTSVLPPQFQAMSAFPRRPSCTALPLVGLAMTMKFWLLPLGVPLYQRAMLWGALLAGMLLVPSVTEPVEPLRVMARGSLNVIVEGTLVVRETPAALQVLLLPLPETSLTVVPEVSSRFQ